MKPTMLSPAVAVLLLATTLLAACAPAVAAQGDAAAAPRVAACDDPVYFRLKSAEPDSLTEREWTRLQQLDQQCAAERQAVAQRASDHAALDHHGPGTHPAMWLWMPAMMLFGGFVWMVGHD